MAVVDVRVAEVEVAGFVTGLAVEPPKLLGRDAVFRSAVVPATLDLRSKVDVVGLVGARVEGVPASDMRLAVPEIPFFSSLELKRDFSSAELLTDARERWEAVVAELRGLRVAVEVVAGRVGGLLSVPPLVDVREEAVVVLEADVVEVGRLVVGVDPDKGLLVVPVLVVEEAVLVGDDGLTFSLESSLSLPASGLVTGSSLPDITEDSTGVAGGTFSVSVSVAGGGATGSSVEAMVF